jgi:hypothetical protein
MNPVWVLFLVLLLATMACVKLTITVMMRKQSSRDLSEFWRCILGCLLVALALFVAIQTIFPPFTTRTATTTRKKLQEPDWDSSFGCAGSLIV